MSCCWPRASNLAGIVRVSSGDPAKILSCLDCGATGVPVPHVATVEKARAIAAAARYRGGRRGYSGSPRAGAYGATPMWALIDEQDASVCAIAMIEDPEALVCVMVANSAEAKDFADLGASAFIISSDQPQCGGRAGPNPVLPVAYRYSSRHSFFIASYTAKE
jgi:staphyloferrin B biosynthesis citrate synthase